MNVRCDECNSVFRVDPQKVPTGGVRARCSVCGGVIRVGAAGDAALASTPAAAAAYPAFAAAAGPGPAFGAATTTAAPGSPEPPTTDPVVPSGFGRPASLTPPPVAPSTLAPSEGAAATPASPPADPAVTPIWTSPNQVPALRHTPSADRSAVPTPAAPSVPQPAPSQGSPVGPRITPRVGPTVSPGGAPRRPINPYLNADPQQKARRLARALVSDIVAYHPQKREEGLRTGALKQLFRDEIKKSYEEYVEQVGKELADSTTHFQDALNDVLAGGRRIF